MERSESSHRLLIRIHLTEEMRPRRSGSSSCERLFRDQLGLEPFQLAQLVANLTN